MHYECKRYRYREKLTSMDTCGDPYPFQVCTRGWQLRLFRTQYQSSMPSFSFLDGRLNYDGSCKWWYQPIVQRQLIRRMQCGMWTPRFYDRDMSKKACRDVTIVRIEKLLILPIPDHMNLLNRLQPSSPIAYECQTNPLARSHSQP